MEWLFARGQRQEMLRIEAEGRPAVLPDDPGVREYHAAAELVIDTLNKRHCQSAVIHDAHPDGIARAFAAAPGGSAGVVDAVGQRLQGFRGEQLLYIHIQMARIGDMRIAQGKRPLGGFDDTVHRLRVVGIGHLQTVGDAKDRQRYQPLRGRGKIPQRSLLVLERQRPRTPGAVGLQVAEGDRHPQRGHPLRQTLGQRPAIKAVETVAGQHAQGTGEGGLAEAAAGPRGLARDQPGFAEARLMAQLFQFAGGGVGLRGSDRNAVFGIADRIGQQAGHRQRAAG